MGQQAVRRGWKVARSQPPTKLRSSSESDSRIGAGSSERRRWTEDSVTYCASRHCGGGTSRPLAEQSTRSNEVYMCSAREASRRVHVRQIGPPTILVRKPR